MSGGALGRALASGSASCRPLEWDPIFPDARLAVTTVVAGDSLGVYVLDLARRLRSRLTANTRGDAVISPDGRWLSFNAALSDRDEVYVSPVPPTGERVQISTSGGTSARWRDDGGELYYVAPDGTLMAVAMSVRDGRLEPSAPTPLLKTNIVPTYNLDHYAVGPGGKTFLLRVPVRSTSVPTVTLLVNWFQ
jgi:hypothetical protein